MRQRHQEQRQRRKERAGEEIGAAPAEPPEPGAVGEVADDRLNEEAGQGRRDPQHRQLVEARAQRLEDAAHVRTLQREADLDSEESEGDVDQPGKRLPRFLHCRRLVHSFALPAAKLAGGSARCNCLHTNTRAAGGQEDALV